MWQLYRRCHAVSFLRDDLLVNPLGAFLSLLRMAKFLRDDRNRLHATLSVCNFQSMKSSVELNSLLSIFFDISPGQLYHLIRRDAGRLANEVFTSNPIVSSKQ